MSSLASGHQLSNEELSHAIVQTANLLSRETPDAEFKRLTREHYSRLLAERASRLSRSPSYPISPVTGSAAGGCDPVLTDKLTVALYEKLPLRMTQTDYEGLILRRGDTVIIRDRLNADYDKDGGFMRDRLVPLVLDREINVCISLGGVRASLDGVAQWLADNIVLACPMPWSWRSFATRALVYGDYVNCVFGVEYVN